MISETTPAGPQQQELRDGLASGPVATLIRLLPFTVLLVNIVSVFAETQDDPFITFRFAANLLAGHGAVFNLGDRVEGYSSPLHLLLCCALNLIFPAVGMLFKAKILGVIFAILTLAQLRPLAAMIGLRDRLIVWAQVLVALNINFAIAAVNGLETTLYGYILIVTACVFLRECTTGKGFASGFWAFLCIVTRPDAMLSAFALFVFRVWYANRNKISASFVTNWLLLLAVPVAFFIAWRFSYYGQIFPNTYYAKLTGIGAAILGGLTYLGHPMAKLGSHAVGLVLFVPVFYGLLIYGWWPMRREVGGLLLLTLFAAAALFVVKVGGDWIPGWRFMIGVLPMLAIAQAVGMDCLVADLNRDGSAAMQRSLALALAVVVIGAWLLAAGRAPRYSWGSIKYATDDQSLISDGLLAPDWIAAAAFIRAHTRPGALIAYSEMGYGSYMNMDRRFLDTRGLCSREVAHVPNQYKQPTGVVDYDWNLPSSPLYPILMRRKPDVIMELNISTPPHVYPSSVLDRYEVVPTAIPHEIVFARR